MTALLIAYGLSVPVATYLIARYADPRLAAAGMLWPVLAAILPLLVAIHYGAKHGGHDV